MRLSILLLLLLLINMVIGHVIQNNIIINTSYSYLANNSVDILETAEMTIDEAKVTGVISHQKIDCNSIVKRLYDEGSYEFTNYRIEYTNEEEESYNNIFIDVILIIIDGLIICILGCCKKIKNKDFDIESFINNTSVTVPATVNNNNRPRNNPSVTINSTMNNNNRSYNRNNYDDDDILPEYKEVDITSSIPTIINIPSSSSFCTTTENNNYHLPTYEECMTNSND